MPEKRTSLNLSSERPFCFSRQLDFSFDLSFASNYRIYFGYIFRLINDKGQNIDLLYDQRNRVFHLVAGETFTEINFQFNDSTLKEAWIPLHFTFTVDGTLSLTTSNRVFKSKVAAFKSTCFKIFFGICSEQNFITTDLPPMKIRNIRISPDNKISNFWPLNESAGTQAIDSVHHQTAKVVNPQWINPRHTNWENVLALNINGRPSVAFDKKKGVLFVVAADSLYTFSITNGNLSVTPLSVRHTDLLAGNQSIVNPFDGNLYNFYVDDLRVSAYDSVSKQWTQNLKSGNLTERWHLNKFITDRNELLLLGGYGQLKYKNIIQRYDLLTRKWDTLKPAGDFYAPRYLSALGANPRGDSAYILGGYGSKEGDQLLSPRFFYDLLVYDVHANRIKKIYELPPPDEQFVFANSMIVDYPAKSYYALIFPNIRFNSELQLIRGSLDQATYTKLGTTLPFSFTDVRSFVDLFYYPRGNKLIAVTIYADQANSSEIKVFSIDFPVNEASSIPVITAASKNRYLKMIVFLLIASVAFGALFYWRFKNVKFKRQAPRPVEPLVKPEVSDNNWHPKATTVSDDPVNNPESIIITPSSAPTVLEDISKEGDVIARNRISLFGNFDVVTDKGVNITQYFTPLLKEMFLLILINSLRYNKGVTSEKMNDILWNDKDIKDAKNNRSVNLVKLKNILEKLGNCSINRKTTAWIFEFDPEVIQIDFFEYLQLSDKSSRQDFGLKATHLLNIVKNGSFLHQTDYEWLNDIKAEISNFVIETLVKYAEAVTLEQDAEKKVMIANKIFQFDELNEHALIIKCKSLIYLGRHALAKTTYDQFIAKYKHIYGSDFDMNYNKILNG